MNDRAFLVVLLSLSIGKHAAASEGLERLGAFTCDAIAVTEAIANDCAAAVEDQSSQISEAFIAWKERNGTAAKFLQQQCVEFIGQSSKTAEDRTAFQSSISRLNSITIAAKVNLPRNQKISHCVKVLRDLKSDELDLSKLL